MLQLLARALFRCNINFRCKVDDISDLVHLGLLHASLSDRIFA